MDKLSVYPLWAVWLVSSLLVSCGPGSGSSLVNITFTASPNPSFQQESATLSWQISGATSANISPGIGEVNASSGSLQVSPPQNTTYTLTATGSSGSANKTLTLTVQPFARPQITDASGSPISGLIVGEAKDVIFSVYVKSGSATIKARRGATEIAALLDNGDLKNGDEILGDGVYSGKAKLNEVSSGTASFDLSIAAGGQTFSAAISLAVAKLPNLTAIGQQIQVVQDGIQTKLNSLPSSTSVADQVKAAADYLNANATALKIASVQASGDLLEIRYTFGPSHSIRFDDAASITNRGPIKGGSGGPTDPDRSATPNLPLKQQTRGETPVPLLGPLADPSSFETTGGRTVLIYSPFPDEFGNALGDSVEQTLKDSKLGFSVTRLSGTNASVKALSEMTKYSYIILDTHGEDGWIVSGEPASADGNKRYLVELGLKEDGDIDPNRPEQMSYYSHAVKDAKGNSTIKGVFYKVNALWFKNHLLGNFKNSIVVAASCESLKSNQLYDALGAKGAGTFFGFSGTVGHIFAFAKVAELTKFLADKKSTGEAYIAAKPVSEPGSSTLWIKRGKDNLKFPLGLTNGGFEDRLTSWKPLGDGRALYQLGSVGALEGSVMGVISTGLGFTTSSGSIEQSFFVDKTDTRLKFSWNFLSEEFLEYIGSSFQDAFKVMIVRNDTNVSQDFLNLNINGVAAKFGASKCSSNTDPCLAEGGSLKKGSPQVAFDKGDVWFTGWQNEEIDLTPYRDQEITLRFLVSDVGDSYYDTAVLLDNVRVE